MKLKANNTDLGYSIILFILNGLSGQLGTDLCRLRLYNACCVRARDAEVDDCGEIRSRAGCSRKLTLGAIRMAQCVAPQVL